MYENKQCYLGNLEENLLLSYLSCKIESLKLLKTKLK